MSLPPLEIGPGPESGAHRFRVGLASPTERWPELARRLAQDIEDDKRAAAWNPTALLDLVGWSATPTEASFYLAGSAFLWVALTGGGLTVPLLRHVPIVLGQTPTSFRLDRRPLVGATYEQTTGIGWPFRIEGPLHARRVTVGAPELSEGQLLGLRELLTSALRRDAWGEGAPPEVVPPTLEGVTLVLPEPLRAGALLEAVHIWAQIFWAEVEWVRWTM